MRLRYDPAALRDLAAICDYIAQHNAGAATRLAARIRAALGRLEAHPHSAPKRRSDDIRILVVPGTPYFALYRVRGEEVQILRIYHGARNIPR